MKKIKRSRIIKSLTIGCVKDSVDKQTVMNQKLEILEYCRTHNLNIDKWIELKVFSKDLYKEKANELLNLLEDDILVSTDISNLGRSTPEILGLVSQILGNKARIIFTKENLDLHLTIQKKITTEIVLRIFLMLAGLERNIISLRIKETLLTRKKRGTSLGKAKGTIQASIYDAKKEQILLLLSKKISVLDTSRIIGIGKPRSLLIYLNKRKLRGEDSKNRKQKM